MTAPSLAPSAFLRIAWALAALLFVAGPVAAQAPVRYAIAFPNRSHHEAEVTLRLADLPPGPVHLRMSRSSPGRYALHAFAKNVYALRAMDTDGHALPVSRVDPDGWAVTGHAGEIVVRYTLFGDRADGTYSGIDQTHAHLNMPATFLWARGLEARPIEVRFQIPEESGWRVATQLAPAADADLFGAPDLAYFMDSPVELSRHDLRAWTVPGPTGPQAVRMAIHARDDEAAMDAYASGARAILEEEAAVFGGYPTFDFGTYTFLACYLPWVDFDGMEHRNSTSLTAAASLERNRVGLLGTVAHEFFHSWNMERIRAADLEPFDFERANMSGTLWFGEGVTSYYQQLALVRAGVIDEEEFARRMGGLVDAVVNGAGRDLAGPAEMSMQAPFVDAAVSIDPTNRPNTFISYYTYGAVVGLELDLTLRGRPDGLSLDDFMRAVWDRYGRTEIPYTLEDLEAALADLSGDPDFARGFFDRFVRGREVADLGSLLGRAGLRLRPARPDVPMLARAPLVPADGGLRVAEVTVRGSPLYRAGVDRGDVLVRVGGVSMGGTGRLERALERRRPGDVVEIEWRSKDSTHRASVPLQEDPTLTLTLEETMMGDPTLDQLAFRARWLGSRAGAGERPGGAR